MAGGQQIDLGQGTLLPDSDRVAAVSGGTSTGAQGAVVGTRIVPLRSRKTGTGAAVFQLSGISSSVGQGLLRQTTPLLGLASIVAQQSMTAGVHWTAVPSVSFVASSQAGVSLGQWVSGYNAATDEFRVTPGYSLPAWLSLTGTGGVNLTPNGTQVDADDVAANPGIKIDVRRSGGAWVSSAAFGVTVAAVSPITATWVNLAYTSVNANKDFYSYGARVDGSGNWLYGPFFNTARQRDYAGMVDGTPDTQAVWDSFATMADDLVHAAPGWVMQETPPWGGWTMYGVNYDFNLVLFVPG